MHLKVSFFKQICNQNHRAQQARCCSTGFIFSNILILRVTARTLLLLYLVVDVIINPVNLRSGKLTRCSEIQCSVLAQGQTGGDIIQ